MTPIIAKLNIGVLSNLFTTGGKLMSNLGPYSDNTIAIHAYNIG